MRKIVIIGNGISGITTARHIRKHSDDPIIIISDETDHFFSRTALMYIYMGHMKYEHTKPYEDWFWDKNKLELKRDRVEKIDTKSKSLDLRSSNKLSYDILIIATGSKPNKFGWPGQDLNGVQGLYSYQDLESMEQYTKDIRQAVVIGGGLIGIEMTEMLLSRDIRVTFLVREESFWDVVLPPEESAMVNRHILEHGVDLRLNTELEVILPDEHGRVKAIRTKDGTEIGCQFVGLTVGVHPNIEFLKDTDIETDKGVLVNEYFETNIPGIYSIGDCAQHRNPLPGRKAIEQVWYTGRIHGETLARTLTDMKTSYAPGGPWFNSAKFFDIEYQVYGDIPNQEKENETSLFWEDSNGKRSIRLAYHQKTEELTGVNLMGVRFRHEICDNWIIEKTSIHEVIRKLESAWFDGEFSISPLYGIRKKYNMRFPDRSVPLKSKNKLFALFT